MSDIFISYARSTEAQAKQIAEELRALGYGVWRDDDLPAHRAYAEVIEERLKAAKAVVVVWSAGAAKSQWVRAEAEIARKAGTLVQLSIDAATPPLPFNQIQCADMAGWAGEPGALGWRKVVASISELVGAEAVTPTPAAPAALPLPSKPSIAVLPFTNVTGAKEDDYFADGMVLEIVTALSRFPSLFVIGSGTSLTFRDTTEGHALIGRELGVRYLLEGAVRKSGERVRISVQLITAADGAQIWAERFDGTLEDVFALQDTVAGAVACRIEPTIQAAEIRRANARPTEDLGAYDLCLRATLFYQRFDKRSLGQALALLDQAIAKDPDYATALALACNCRGNLLMMGWSEAPEEDQRIGLEMRARSLRLGGDDPDVLANLACPGLYMGVDKAACEAIADRALALNPGSSFAWLVSGLIKAFGGKANIALQQLESALRLDPRSGWRPLTVTSVGLALFVTRRFEEAITTLIEVGDLLPGLRPLSERFIAAAHAHLGRLEEARRILQALSPVSIDHFLALLAPDDRELYIAGLALAGVDA